MVNLCLPPRRWWIGTSLGLVTGLSWMPVQAPALVPDPSADPYAVRVWTEQDGLPQGSIEDIVQTADGYLWLATRGGLVRFDGLRFTVFDRNQGGGLTNSWITGLAVDSRGVLWIGSNDGLFSYRAGRFEPWHGAPGLRRPRIIAIENRTAGGIWLSIYGRGLGLLDVEDSSLRMWSEADGLSTSAIVALHEDRAGTLWIGTWSSGLIRFRDGVFERLAIDSRLEDLGFWAIQEDRRGRLWVGGGRGLLLLQDDEVVLRLTADDGLPSNQVQALLKDRAGSLWLGSYGRGIESHALARVVEAEQGFEIEAFGRAQGLATSDLYSMYEDASGNLWLGSVGGGLYQLRKVPFSTLGLTDGLRSEAVRSVTRDAAGALWAATAVGGLHRLGPGGEHRVFTTADGLPTNRLSAVVGDATGHVWVGTSGAGLVRWRDGRVERLYTAVDGLPHDLVRGLHPGREAGLWVFGDGGVGRLIDERFETWTEEDGLADDLVRALVEARSGDVWIGTVRGLQRLRRGRLEAFTVDAGLPSARISALYEGADGALWVGTSSGIARFKEGRFVTLQVEQELASREVTGLIEDAAGDLWVSGSNEVLRLRRRQLEAFFAGRLERVLALRYGTTEGFVGGSFADGNQPAVWRAADGRLWFATQRGVAVVDPAQLVDRTPAPRARIQSLAVGGASQAVPDLLQLISGTTRLEIELTALSFDAPNLLSFRYRLEGFDQGWTEARNRRAVYTNLPAGRYVFQAMARHGHGDWGEVTAGLPIVVVPRLLERRGFRAGLVLLLFGAAFAGHWLRVLHARRREAVLSSQVESAVARIKVLGDMLPICSRCKKVRDDRGFWTGVESYLAAHTEADVDRCLCPRCAAERHMPAAVKTDSAIEVQLPEVRP